MGKVRRHSIEALVWFGLATMATGCSSFEFIAISDDTVSEAIFGSLPFQAPLTIEVESNLARPCSLIASEGSPRAWIALRDAKVGALEPIVLADGSAGCALTPLSRSAQVGRMGAWKPTESGRHWKIPVGIYALNGTGTFDGIVTDRSVVRSGSVVFPWTFYPMTGMKEVVLSETTAADQGLTGQARAQLARTSEGWKLVSLEMTPIELR